MFRRGWQGPLAVLLLSCGAKTGLQEQVCDGGPSECCTPGIERCNGRDDDCDGVEDDGIACFFLDGAPIAPVPSVGCGAAWYGYDFPDLQSANPVPDIRRSDEVVMAVHYDASCGGAYLAIIADLPMDGSGGQLDAELAISPAAGAGVVVSDEPGECAFDAAGGSGTCNWVWQPCCTDGALIGAFTGDACVDVRLHGAAGVSRLVVLDGPDAEIPRSLPATLEICVRLRPAVP